jgi:hypothetical protein
MKSNKNDDHDPALDMLSDEEAEEYMNAVTNILGHNPFVGIPFVNTTESHGDAASFSEAFSEHETNDKSLELSDDWQKIKENYE